MRRAKHTGTACGRLGEHRGDDLGMRLVLLGAGLVQGDEGALDDKCAGHPDPLTFSAGEQPHGTRADRGKAERADRLVDQGGMGGQAARDPGKGQVLHYVEWLGQRAELRRDRHLHPAQVGTGGPVERREIRPTEDDPPMVGVGQPGEQPQQCRLARPGSSAHNGQHPCRDVQVAAVEDDAVAVRDPDVLDCGQVAARGSWRRGSGRRGGQRGSLGRPTQHDLVLVAGRPHNRVRAGPVPQPFR